MKNKMTHMTIHWRKAQRFSEFSVIFLGFEKFGSKFWSQKNADLQTPPCRGAGSLPASTLVYLKHAHA